MVFYTAFFWKSAKERKRWCAPYPGLNHCGFNASVLVRYQKQLACVPQCNPVTLSCTSEASRSSVAQLVCSRHVFSNGDRRNSTSCRKPRKVSVGVDNVILSDGISERTPYHEHILHRREPCLAVCYEQLYLQHERHVLSR